MSCVTRPGRDGATVNQMLRLPATCHDLLSAQLLRAQQELSAPLLSFVHPRHQGHTGPSNCRDSATLDHADLIRTAKAIQQATLFALVDQYTRMMARPAKPTLPPPRFSITLCPLAVELQKQADGEDPGPSSPRDSLALLPDLAATNPRGSWRSEAGSKRWDEREVCPQCQGVLHVSKHFGLGEKGRALLFQSHIPPPSCSSTPSPAPTSSKVSPSRLEATASYACRTCYKPFASSYAFLDHMYQLRQHTDRSCLLRRRVSVVSSGFATEDDSSVHTAVPVKIVPRPEVVQRSLRNCIRRESTRGSRAMKAKERGTGDVAQDKLCEEKGRVEGDESQSRLEQIADEQTEAPAERDGSRSMPQQQHEDTRKRPVAAGQRAVGEKDVSEAADGAKELEMEMKGDAKSEVQPLESVLSSPRRSELLATHADVFEPPGPTEQVHAERSQPEGASRKTLKKKRQHKDPSTERAWPWRWRNAVPRAVSRAAKALSSAWQI